MWDYFAALPPDDFWFWAAGSCAATVAGFYFAFRSLRRARIIEDTPTARVRSAPQGYVELEGTAEVMDGEPVVAPLSGLECCWWQYEIHRKGPKGGWNIVEQKTSDDLFLLKDETGSCIIDPEGAEVTPADRKVWYGSNHYPGRYGTDGTIGILSEYRYTEKHLYAFRPLYAIGLFHSLGDSYHTQARGEIARALLREWKSRPEVMHSFDKNGDGTVDPQEWEQVRKSASIQAANEYRTIQARQIPHMLSRPPDNHQPFLLSTYPQHRLVRRYRLTAAIAIAVFFAAGAFATAILTARFFA